MRFLLASCAAVVVACGDLPTSQSDASSSDPSWASAAVTKELLRESFAFTNVNPCTGDILDFTGDVLVTFTHIDQPTGGVHEKLFLSFKGTGISQTTGTVYRFQHLEHGSLNQGPDGVPFGDTFRFMTRVSAPGAGDDFSIFFWFHVRVNANGEVTSFRDPFEIVCR